MLTRAWYPMRLFMVTLFWMTKAVMGMRGNTDNKSWLAFLEQ